MITTVYWVPALEQLQAGSSYCRCYVALRPNDLHHKASAALGLTAGMAAQVIGNTTYDSTQGVYTLDCGCKCVSSLPWVSFVLQGQTFSLPPTAYIMQASLSAHHGRPPIIWNAVVFT